MLYDPATAEWSSAGRFQHEHQGGAAVLLADGRVAVVGGTETGSARATVETYSPSSNAWSEAPSMHYPRASPTAALLSEDCLVVFGGEEGDAPLPTELWDLTTDTWTTGPTPSVRRAGAPGVHFEAGIVTIGGPDLPRSAFSGRPELIYADRVVPLASLGSQFGAGQVMLPLGAGKLLVAGGDPRGDGSPGRPTADAFVWTEPVAAPQARARRGGAKHFPRGLGVTGP